MPAVHRLVALVALLLSLAWNPVAAADADPGFDAWAAGVRQGVDKAREALQAFDRATGETALLTGLARNLMALESRIERRLADLELELTNVRAKLDTLGPAPAAESGEVEDPQVTASRQQLTRQIRELERQAVALRALLLASGDQLAGITGLEQQVVAERLLGRGPNFLAVLRTNLEQVEGWWSTSASLLRSVSGIEVLEDQDLLALGVLVFLILPVAIGAKQRIARHRMAATGGEPMGTNMLAALRACLGHSGPALAVFGIVSLYLTAALPADPLPLVTQTAYAVVLFLLLNVVVRSLLRPCPPAWHYLPLDPAMAQSMARRLRVLLGLGVLGYMLFHTPYVEQLPLAQFQLVHGIYIVVLVANVLWVIALLGGFSAWGHTYRVRGLLALIFLAAAGAELLGYRNLALLVIAGMIGTLLVLGLAWLLGWLSEELFDGLQEGRRPWHARLRSGLGLAADDPFPGLLWLRLVTTLALWAGAALLVMRAWGVSDRWVDYLSAQLTDGFTVGNITIAPLQILGAVLVFVVLLSASNWFKQRLVPRWLGHTRLDRGAREAMVTISGYSGVILAVLVGLSVAGLEFKNLALIAGALSVGIGFGLQNVVNNFVSGIILLFERPIRTGDWVVVGNTEGYVRRISIRSTTIQTFDRADVIVPNSELIANQVTNWMLRDPWGRVVVPVGVAYSSEPEQVEKILLDIAHKHPLTMTDGRLVLPPRVLFRGFGDNSLNFELRFFIRNVDSRLTVLSDVNHAIFKAFREAGITIPFPQRDVYIRYPDAERSAGTGTGPDTAP